MIYLFYQIVAWTVFLIVFPFFFIYTLGGGSRELRQRLGLYPPATAADPADQAAKTPPGERAPGKGIRIWLHAASVGEVQVARALVGEIERELPAAEIWVSTLTRHGRQVAREQMPAAVRCIFAPVDLAFSCSRALRHIDPDLYVCLETELWPEMIRQAAHRGAGPVLLNARLTARSLRRYRRWPTRLLIGNTVASFQAIAAIGADDAQRYRELGADPARITVCGNAKYDLEPKSPRSPDSDSGPAGITGDTSAGATKHRGHGSHEAMRRQLGIAPDQPVLVCGSTHEGEEELLLAAWRKLKRNLPGLVCIMAPRHLKRLPELETTLQQRDLAYHKLSELADDEIGSRSPNQQPPATDQETGLRASAQGVPPSALMAAASPTAMRASTREPARSPQDVVPPGHLRPPGLRATLILVDRMGELATLYGVADYVFCGGSLVRRGGHNLLEAAIHGKPVLFGPYMDDFREDAELLQAEGGGFLVRHDDDICQRIMAFHTRPTEYHQAAERARAVAGRLRGAARQQVKILKKLIAPK